MHAVSAFAVALQSGAGWAQTGTPGAVAPPTREEVSPPPAAPAASTRVRIEGGIERAPCPLDDPAYANVRVTVTEAVFNNLKGVSPDELLPAYRGLLGQERPISVVCEIRDAAATVLRNRGYLAAIQVPVQLLGVVADEHDRLRRVAALRGLQHIVDHRATRDRVEELKPVGELMGS